MLRFLIYALALLNVATALNVGPLTTPNHLAVVSRSSQIVCAEAKYVLSHASPFFIWREHFADARRVHFSIASIAQAEEVQEEAVFGAAEGTLRASARPHGRPTKT